LKIRILIFEKSGNTSILVSRREQRALGCCVPRIILFPKKTRGARRQRRRFPLNPWRILLRWSQLGPQQVFQCVPVTFVSRLENPASRFSLTAAKTNGTGAGRVGEWVGDLHVPIRILVGGHYGRTPVGLACDGTKVAASTADVMRSSMPISLF
jgi:hypothetical protein